MTKEIVYCDRCGNVINYPIDVRYRLYNGGSEHKRVDLCQSCIDDLCKWLRQSRNENII